MTFELVLAHLRNSHFAVISTSDDDGTPHSAGVNYGVSRPDRELAIYVMLATSAQGAKHRAESECLASSAIAETAAVVSAASDHPIAWPSPDR